MLRFGLVSLVFLQVFSNDGAEAYERSLNVSVDPGCPEATTCGATSEGYRPNLVYILSQSTATPPSPSVSNPDPSYRILWSTIGAPTVLVTEAPAGSDLHLTSDNLKWMEFIEDSKHDPSSPFLFLWGGRFAGLTISKLIEFNDTKSIGKVSDSNATFIYDLSSPTWYPVTLTNEPNGRVDGTFKGLLTSGGVQRNLTVIMSAFSTNDRTAMPPHMLVTPSLVTVRVILDNLPVHFERSKFALELIYASNDASNTTANHSVERSTSDQYSPGVFTVERVSGSDTFVQWRPVVYTSANPGVSDSTRSTTSDLLNITMDVDRNHTDTGMPYSLLQGLAGLTTTNSNTLVRFNVSFGENNDGYYNTSKYQEWLVEVGIGRAPHDTVTKSLKWVIAVALGIPAALLLVGALYAAYVKFGRSRLEDRTLLVKETTTVTNYDSVNQ
ncbi:hypothetical protein RvY_00407 [Ramazzottius varieornatus]|uniref:Uncharacterized protein n=1 Tax=Ramazzottius varieornatus TaxID=947166 RepID=A0A1D1UDM2_RAMVA|nr:hypothetical protein RvY_00407 [Ramazzottius varieornatus]